MSLSPAACGDTDAGREQKWFAPALGVTIAGAALYLGWALVRAGEPGYPLDDAWIHQVFARNLAQTGQFAFNPGELAAGSTAPLWTVLLVPGYWLPPGPLAWTYLLGSLALLATGWLTLRLARSFFPGERWLGAIAMFAVLTEWHLAWAALSGMETPLFIALSLWLILLYYQDASPALIGLAAGLLTAARPEGLLLAGLVALAWPVRQLKKGEGPGARGKAFFLLRGALIGVAVFALVVAPVGWHNYRAAGSPLPSTMPAKITNYGAGVDLRGHLLFLLLLPLSFMVGSLLLAVPLSLWGAFRALRCRLAVPWLPLAWCAALIGVYAWRLPVLYHHSRYLMPLVPWIILYGLLALAGQSRQRLIFYLAINGIVFLVFWVQGANIYSWNVKNINDQQVTIGHWLAANTPPDAVVAATDIGAVGYFGQRRVLDLEGLTSPEITRRRRMGEPIPPYLRQAGADYLIVYGDDPPPYLDELTGEVVYRARLPYNTISATADMVVYRLHWPASPASSLPHMGRVREEPR
jgi:arabinofuranosyltransferase